MSEKKKEIRIYSLPSKKEPFTEWVKELDKTTRNRIWRRIDRLEMSNPGDFKRISKDICELRIHFGSGYRVYYSELDEFILILLCAGDKKSTNIFK